MTERDGLFLAHILAAIVDIESFTTDGRSGFMADRKCKVRWSGNSRSLAKQSRI